MKDDLNSKSNENSLETGRSAVKDILERKMENAQKEILREQNIIKKQKDNRVSCMKIKQENEKRMKVSQILNKFKNWTQEYDIKINSNKHYLQILNNWIENEKYIQADIRINHFISSRMFLPRA